MRFYTVFHIIDAPTKALFEDEESEKFFCPICGSVYKSVRTADYKYGIRGKKRFDALQAPGCYLGNEKVFEVLEKYHITGYEKVTAKCVYWYTKNGKEVPHEENEYHEIKILGKCGPMCDQEGKVIPGCEECGWVRFFGKEVGLSVDESTWDGSDIFSFSNWLGVMICSEKMKEAFEKEKIKGYEFRLLEEVYRP